MSEESWWTKERLAELKERVANRESGTQICLAMGAKSRNAVLGKAWRLGLHLYNLATRVGGGVGNRPPTTRNVRKRTARRQKTRIRRGMGTVVKEDPTSAVALAAELIFKNPKPLLRLRANDCRWPEAGEVRHDMLFCAAPVAYGQSYCPHHCQIAYHRSR